MFNFLESIFNDNQKKSPLDITLSEDFANFGLLFSGKGFVAGDNCYLLSFNVSADAEIKDFDVELGDDNIVTITYRATDCNSSSKLVLRETLPLDADANSLRASLYDGKFVLSVCRVKEKDSSIESHDSL